MKIGREELEDLKEGLEKLTHFIRVMEGADRKRNSCTVIDDLGLSDHSSGRRSIKKRVYF